MNEEILQLVGTAVLVSLAVTVGAWIVFFVHWSRMGRFPLLLRDRRPIPWTTAPAVGLLLFGLIFPSFLTEGFQSLVEKEPKVPAIAPSTEQMADHPALIAVRQEPQMTPTIFFVVALVAPGYEEFLFRLLLLGGLESTLWRIAWRKRWPLRKWFPSGTTMAIFLTGFLFAALHIRPTQSTQISPIFLSWELLLFHGTAQILVGVLILAVLRRGFGARITDLGLDPGPSGRFWIQDIKIGLFAAALTIVPLFVLQGIVRILFQSLHIPMVSDPVAIFLLAIVLGGMYIRTRRLLPCVVLHSCLNAISVALTVLQSQWP